MDHQVLLKRVEDLLEKTEGAAFVVPADTGHFSIDDDLVKKVREAMAEAVDLLRELSDFYDQVGETEGRAAKGDASLTATQRAELEKLEGLDDELDELLLAPDVTPADLKTPIARLYQVLHPPRAPNMADAFCAPFDK